MNRYVLSCVLAGALIGAAIGLANDSSVIQVALSAAAGAAIGYAASALRPSSAPVHPYARPADRSDRDSAENAVRGN